MQANTTQSILITGCSTGIGLATAIALRQKGHTVIATARTEEALQMLANQGVLPVRLDLRESDSIRAAVNDVSTITEGKLDCLINNGGYSQPGAIEDLSRDSIRAVFETNVFGWIELTNLVLPMMRARNAGKIIQLSSAQGILAMPYRGAYAATKHAIEAFSDVLRLELRETGIQVSILQPGPILTAFKKNAASALQRYVDIGSSQYSQQYRAVINRLNAQDKINFYSASAEAVAKKIVHIVESPRLKVRYRITVIACFFEWLRRALPYRFLDKTIIKLSGGGAR